MHRIESKESTGVCSPESSQSNQSWGIVGQADRHFRRRWPGLFRISCHFRSYYRWYRHCMYHCTSTRTRCLDSRVSLIASFSFATVARLRLVLSSFHFLRIDCKYFERRIPFGLAGSMPMTTVTIRLILLPQLLASYKKNDCTLRPIRDQLAGNPERKLDEQKDLQFLS